MLKRRTAVLALTAAAVVGVPAIATTADAAPAPARRVATFPAPFPTPFPVQFNQLKLVLTGGATTLALDPATAGVLTQNGVAVAPVGEAVADSSGISFPIEGGVLDPFLRSGGKINHDGGLTFTAGGKSLTIRDFVINTGTRQLTAFADEANARIPVLDLNVAAVRLAVKRDTVTLSGVKATLTGTAATALNGFFGTSLFTKGLSIGTVTVNAESTAVRTI